VTTDSVTGGIDTSVGLGRGTGPTESVSVTGGMLIMLPVPTNVNHVCGAKEHMLTWRAWRLNAVHIT
jgi:hypothetical protein